MSSGPGAVAVADTATTTVRLRAMATDVTLTVVAPAEVAGPALERAGAVFTRVEASCTRFRADSPLMLANASGLEWHVVPPECFDAVSTAWWGYRQTGGLFDPRVLDPLVELGYDRTLPFTEIATDVTTGIAAPHLVASLLPAATGRLPARPWRPAFDAARQAVRLGEHRVDLGGIGKGLAVRRAADELATVGAPFLVEAGGDLAVGGDGPDGRGWLVGVEDPASGPDGGADPIAVLRLADRSCATSSVRVRRWQFDGRPVHHLIDPRTGRSSTTGLHAVTVVGADAATAEVWSKALFVLGRDAIADTCRARGLAALWVGDDGAVGLSDALRPYLVWQADDAR